MQEFTTNADGHAAGALLVVETMLAMIIARHPDRDRLLDMSGFAEDLREQAVQAAADNSELFLFLSDMATGAEQAIATIQRGVKGLTRG